MYEKKKKGNTPDKEETLSKQLKKYCVSERNM